MALTPIDIHNKEFARKLRGYNEDQVDQYLDKIVEEFERIYKENLESKEKISALVDQLSQYKTIEDTLKETLITAQKTADEVTASAQRKAELILREAEEQSRKIISMANENVLDIQREYQENRKQMLLFKAKFRTMLEIQMEMVLGNKELAEAEAAQAIE